MNHLAWEVEAPDIKSSVVTIPGDRLCTCRDGNTTRHSAGEGQVAKHKMDSRTTPESCCQALLF